MLWTSDTDRGTLIKIIKEPPRYTPQPQPLGPNVVISGLLPPQTRAPDTTPEVTKGTIPVPQRTHTESPDPYPLWSMMQMMYFTLNESNPNLTNPCCLCYDIKPPVL